MKKQIAIVVIIIIILILILFIWWLDMNRVIEEAYSLQESTYKIEELGEDVNLILYNIEENTRDVTIYKFTDDKVSDILYEKHYKNKLEAMRSFEDARKDMKEAKLNKNIISGRISDKNIGLNKDELLDDLNKLEKVYNKIEQ